MTARFTPTAARRYAVACLCIASLALTACGSDEPVDGPLASTNVDSGPADTGQTDTGVQDSGTTDTGVNDTTPTDTGTTDTGVKDTNPNVDVQPVDTKPPVDAKPDTKPPTDAAPECTNATDCVPSTDPCKVAACTSGQCVLADGPDGKECTDDDACTGPDLCKTGVCLPGKATQCDDANACTLDNCDKNKGCSHTNVSLPCDDGSKCTLADQCKDGACLAGATAECDDANPCTDNTCEPAIGCVTTATTKPCDDANACTLGDKCSAKVCLPGTVTNCNDDNPCTTDACDSKTGCTQAFNKVPCSDNDACTIKDACKDGSCKPGTKLDCDDSNPCTADACDAQSGCTTKPNTATCDDNNLCTEDDSCKGGKCLPGKSKSCSDGNPCTTDSCDPATGCAFKLNSGQCDDGNACTDFDICKSGKCRGVAKDTKTDCNDANPCTTDACDPGSAQVKGKGCVHTNNTAKCDDGNACSAGDACKDGKCAAGKNVCACTEDKHCAPSNPKNPCLGTLFCDKSAAPFKCKLNPASVVKCSGAGDTLCAKNQCDPKDLKCKVTPIAEGQSCNADNSVCTVGDACKNGKCAPGKALACNDANPCTNDACDPKAGCVNTANSAPCNADGNPCTVGDVCVAKACTAGKKKDCDDGDKCSDDSCDKKSGKCVNDKIAGCGGHCQEDKHCDDGTTCTTESCAKAKGAAWGKCAYKNQPGKCTDFNACTAADHCVAGKCVGTAKSCSDGNPCTNDGCDPTSGCTFPHNTAPCDDFDKCTQGDQCKAGKCAAGTPKKCDDADKCTKNACNPADGACSFKGIAGCGGYCDTAADCDDKNPCTTAQCNKGKCVSSVKAGGCEDGNKCTLSDKCSAGKCVSGSKKSCDDKNACTTDSCDTKTGQCANKPLKAGDSCNDNNKCSTKDVCKLVSGKLQCGGTTKNCDDGNKCTDDACDAKTGNCQPKVNTLPCEDGNKCTAGDRCKDGKCVTGAKVYVDTFAGSGPIHGNKGGFVDGPGNKAKFSYPLGVAVNSKGVVYVADASNHRIRRIAADGTVSTAAGSGKAGLLDAKGTAAWFNAPYGVAIGPGDEVFVADQANYSIRKIATDGTVSTVAGSGQGGHVNGDAAKARFNRPFGVAVSKAGTIFVADTYNHRIRRIAFGQVTTLAGSGGAGFTNGTPTKARFYYPIGVAIDAGGNVLVADQSNHRIRRVDAKGNVTTFAGTGGYGSLNGSATKATFRNPWGIAVDNAGVVWIGDRYSHRIRRIAGGVVTTFAASGAAGFVDGAANTARLYYPSGVAVDAGGTLYIADQYTHRVRRVRDSTAPCLIGGSCYANGAANPANGCERCVAKTSSTKWTAGGDGNACSDGDVCTAADKCSGGSCKGSAKVCNDSDKCTLDSCDKSTGQCVFAPINKCGGNCKGASDCADNNPCTIDKCTNGKCANSNADGLVCNDGNSCTLGDACKGGKCQPGASNSVSTHAGSGVAALTDGKGIKASFNYPRGVDVGVKGELWVAEGHSHRIRKVAADGTVTTVAGSGVAGFADGKLAGAMFQWPHDVSFAKAGVIHVADGSNHRIRTVDTAKGVVTTLAGIGAGFTDGPAAKARFNNPYSLATAPNGTVFVADYSNHRIRAISPAGGVSTLAGGAKGFVNGTGSKARFNGPIGIALDQQGRVVVSDYSNHSIRRVTMQGVVTTIGGTGVAGYRDGSAGVSRFRYPWGITTDSAGRVFVADRHNHRIRAIHPNGTVTRIAGTTAGFLDGDGLTKARLHYPMGLAADANGTLWVGDYSTRRIRKVVPSANACSIGGACYANGIGSPTNGCQACAGQTNSKAWTARADGAVCSDGDVCSGKDACASGKCASKKTNCDDGNKCTKDFCDHLGVCRNEPIVGCDGFCYQHADCDDKNVCTDDVCNANKCANPTNVKPCEDGVSCTLGDTCSGGKCKPGTAVWTSTIAGNGKAGFKDGKVTDAQFYYPLGIAVDSGKGHVYVADNSNHRLRRIAADGTATTIAGSGKAGFGDGAAAIAQLRNPSDVEIGPGGGLYFADRGNHRIRVLAAGKVTTVAGSTAGYANGKAAAARFNNPYGIAVSSGGVVYVADYSNHRVRRILPDGSVSLVAGSGAGYVNGKGAAARLHGPIDVALDRAGNLFVVEHTGHRVRRITPDGVTSLVAGSVSNQAGYVHGKGATARFRYPWGIAVAPNGRIYVADGHNHRIREIVGDVAGHFAGSGTAGFANGTAGKAAFYYPRGIGVGADGAVYIGDQYNHRIRKIVDARAPCAIGSACYAAGTPATGKPCSVCDAAKNAKAWTTLANSAPCEDGNYCTEKDACASGSCAGSKVSCDDSDKCTTDSCNAKSGACVHTKIVGCNGFCTEDKHCDDGNPCTQGDLCINNTCGKGTRTVSSTLAGTTIGFQDGDAKTSKLNRPYDVAVDSKGALYVADYNNNRIRKVAGGKVSTLAGSGQAGLKSGKGTAAWFNRPSGVTTDAAGNVYVADRYSYTIRKVTADGTVSTLAGNGAAGASNGKGSAARFNQPIGIASTAGGVLYVADYNNQRIRRVTADGTVSTLAGSSYGYADGKGSAAKFRYPIGIAVDRAGNAFVTDFNNHRIRKVTADGVVTTVAGSGSAGLLNGDAKTAKFYNPWGIAVDGAGRVYIGSYRYHRLRVLDAGTVYQVTGSSAGYVDGAAGRFYHPLGITTDVYGNIFVADYWNNRIRQVSRTANACSISGACWTDGVHNPGSACQACAGSKSAKGWSAIADGQWCEDGAMCTVGDVCKSGKCTGGAKDCDDKNKCTTDSCDATTGACTYKVPDPKCKP